MKQAKGITIVQLMVILLIVGLVVSLIVNVIIDKRCEANPAKELCADRKTDNVIGRTLYAATRHKPQLVTSSSSIISALR